MNTQDTLDIYDMGSIDYIFESDNPRLMKKHFKQAIRKEWNIRLKEECAGKSSLRRLHLPPDEQLHIIWRDMNCQSHTRKATIKAMMTTGCYMMLNGSTKTKSTPHVSSAISVNPRTSTPSCASVPTRRLRTTESASYRDSSGNFTLHWVLRDSTNIPSTMRSSNWHYTVLPTTLMSHVHTHTTQHGLL